jgi:hypothetical protein
MAFSARWRLGVFNAGVNSSGRFVLISVANFISDVVKYVLEVCHFLLDV